MAEDAWNTRDPDKVVLVYTEDTRWRNRAEFPVGREQVRQFLVRKWAKELDYKESDRKFRWPLGRRPDAHPGLSDLGL